MVREGIYKSSKKNLSRGRNSATNLVLATVKMATTISKNGLFTPLTPSLPACPPIVDRIETLPVTPPDSAAELSEDERSRRVDSRLVKKALHVISTERDALTHLEDLYATSPDAQLAFSEAVKLIASTPPIASVTSLHASLPSVHAWASEGW